MTQTHIWYFLCLSRFWASSPFCSAFLGSPSAVPALFLLSFHSHSFHRPFHFLLHLSDLKLLFHPQFFQHAASYPLSEHPLPLATLPLIFPYMPELFFHYTVQSSVIQCNWLCPQRPYDISILKLGPLRGILSGWEGMGVGLHFV